MKYKLLLLILLFSTLGFSQEICNNGIDDDGDGKIDLNDSDCTCSNSVASSLINNYNFEQKIFCPNDFAQFNAVSNWYLPSSATSDYINSCGFVPASATDAGIYPLPTSNGNGVAGILVAQDYKEFIGICTNTTLLAGTKYQLNFDIASSTSGRILSTNPNIGQVCNDGFLNAGKLDITLYGKSNCLTSTPPNTNNFPGGSGWVPLGKASYLPTKNWNQLSIVFTPTTNVNSIMLGSPQTLPNTYVTEYDYRSCFSYFYFDNVILNNASNLGLSISATGSYCDNTLTLHADIDSSIGSGYSYQWYKDGISIVGSTSSTLNINYNVTSIGNYQVRITNSSSCKISPFYNVNTVLDLPDYSIDQSPCSPGITTLTITTPADSYSFDNGATWSTNPSKGNLTAYYNPIKILIKKNGCISGSRYVVLAYPPLATIAQPQLTVVQPGCQTNGSITVITPALEYSFDDGVTWTTNPVLNNLPPNQNYVYKVKIKTLLGCITGASQVTMYPFFLPQPMFTSTNASCGVGGSITITTSASEYSFDNGVTWTTNPTKNNLNSGVYRIKIKNNLGCISLDETVYIVNILMPVPLFTSTQPTCIIGGSITITTSAFQYTFDGGITWTTNPTANNLPADHYYTLGIMNSSGCVSLFTNIYLSSSNDIAPDVIVTPNTCETGASIQVVTPASEYSFDDGVTWTNSNTIINLPPGQYYIKTKSSTGCISYTKYIFINPYVLPAPTYAVTEATCGVSAKINIYTTAQEYSVDNGVTWSLISANMDISPGNHFLVVRNFQGCSSDLTNPIYIHINNSLPIPSSPLVTINNPTNCISINGSITVTTIASVYSFDNGVTWTTNSTSPSLPPGTYYVKIKHGTGCASNATAAVISTPPDAPTPPTLNISQPLSCSNPTGSISITSVAFQYSFDNGMTWGSNPTSAALPVGEYLVKVRNSLNCESSAVFVTIIAPTDYPTAPNFTIVQPDCSNLKGFISIISLASEYSFDNGVSWSLNSTSIYLNPGSYQIKIKNSSGCVSPASNAIIIPFTAFPNFPIVNSPQNFCIQDNATLNNITISGQNIQWYDALTNGNVLANTTILQNGINYYASQTINGCESLRVPVTANIQNTPAPTGSDQSFCATQNPTLTDIIISGTGINWYSSTVSTGVLPTTMALVNGVTYYATQTVNGCESVNRLPVTVTLINTLNAADYNEILCDDLNDGNENINLTAYNSNLISNTSGCTFEYYNSFLGATNQSSNNLITNPTVYSLGLGLKTIYVRITSSNGCHQIVELQLTLVKKPVIPISDIMPICEGSSITVDAGLGYDGYLWSTNETTSSIVISTPGNYSVTVDENHGTLKCTSIKNFSVVKSNVATISQVITSDWTDNENTITAMLTGSSVGDYVYSLDGITYQSSNTFTGLGSGEYTVYVKDRNGCGITSDDFYLLMYPKFFTPNGDGFHDTWQIKFSKNESNLVVKLFDRFGKLLKVLDNNKGWNGTLNNMELPATDYWFVVIRANGKEYKGHFALKR